MRFVIHTFGGDDDLYLQAWYAILSLMAYSPAGSEIVVVTDAPHRYAWFGERVRIVPVDATCLREWRGPHDYKWRIKLEVVRLAASLGTEPIVYCDCDVAAQADLRPMLAGLQAGDVFMHHRELELREMRRPSMRRLRELAAGGTWAGIQVDDHDAMWNAGVVGVGDRRLLDRALALSDELMATPLRHPLSEQLAFSLTLAATGRLRPANGWFAHYWDNKRGWLISISTTISAIPLHGFDVSAAVEHVRTHPIRRPVQVRRRWWNRYFVKLAGADY